MIAYDRDAATKPAVAAAAARLEAELSRAELRVLRASWPDPHKGLDDALTAGVLPVVEPIGAVGCDEVLAANAAKDGRIAELEAEIAATRHTLAIVIQTATNSRNLGDSGGAVAVLVAADVHRQAITTPTPDGFYNVNPKRVADAWKDHDGGQDRPAIIGESTIRRYVKRFAEASLFDVAYREDAIVKTVVDTRTGELIDKQLPIRVPWVRYAGSLADQLAPLAAHHAEARPNRGGARPRTKTTVLPAACPECGHAIAVSCPACGAVPRPVEVELADAEAARLDRTVPIDVVGVARSGGQLDRSRNGTGEEHKSPVATIAPDQWSRGQVERATTSVRWGNVALPRGRDNGRGPPARGSS